MMMLGGTLSSEETTYLQLHPTQEVTIVFVHIFWGGGNLKGGGGWYTTLVLINQLINHKLTPSQWSWLYYDLFSLHTHTQKQSVDCKPLKTP